MASDVFRTIPEVASVENTPSTNTRYTIYDYFKPSKSPIYYSDFSSWKDAILELTQDKMTINWNHCTTPSTTLGPVGPSATSSAASSLLSKLRISKHHGLFHKFLTAELTSTVAVEHRAVSFEKGQKGLLFQIAKSLATVRETREGQFREKVRLHDSSSLKGFEGALVDNLATIRDIFHSIETNAAYDLWSSNRQRAVSDWQSLVVETSLDLNFNVPGSRDRISLNDDKIVETLEAMYPKWAARVVQRLPEIPNPFAIEPIVPLAAKDNRAWTHYQRLVKKQSVVEAVTKMLVSWPRDRASGRKAVVSNLSKGKFDHALTLTNQSSRTVIDDLSELWSVALELVVVLEWGGVVIFAFQEENDDNHETINAAVDLADKIEKRPNDVIHVINVAFDAENDEEKVISAPYGPTRHVSLSEETRKDEAKLRSSLDRWFETITYQSYPSVGNILAMRKFTAKLFLLQNMENENVLIHRRPESRERGPSGFCIWTSQQRELLDEAKGAFIEGRKIDWNIRGGFGSGKTLTMMQIAWDFVKHTPDGKAFVLVWHGCTILIEQLQKQVEKFPRLEGERIFVLGHDNNKRGTHPTDTQSGCAVNWQRPLQNCESPVITLVDELFLFDDPSLPRLWRKGSRIIFTSFDFPMDESTECRYLEKTLRSSKQVTKFVAKFQQRFPSTDLRRPTSYPLEPALAFDFSPQPKVFICDDASLERGLFLSQCQSIIVDVSKDCKATVLVSAVGSFEENLQRALAESNQIEFIHFRKASGCQFPCVVLILEPTTSPLPTEYVTMIMSRATTALYVIVNVARWDGITEGHEIIEFFQRKSEAALVEIQSGGNIS